MLLLKFDCSGGAAIKDRAHSRMITDGATKNCSIILFQKKKRFIPLTGVVSGFFQDGCPTEKTGGKLRERESARPQTHLYIQRKPSQMPHLTKIRTYSQLKMIILPNL